MRRVVLRAAALLAALVSTPVAGAWTWPATGPVLQPFVFDPLHPYAGGQHRGIDVGGGAGAEALAPAGGTISFAGSVPGSGKSVTIQTTDGLSVTLTHLGSIAVVRTAAVAEGATVGTIGPSGPPEVAVPYVHLGVRITAQAQGYLDPVTFLPARVSPPPPAPEPAPAPAVVPVPAAPAPDPGAATDGGEPAFLQPVEETPAEPAPKPVEAAPGAPAEIVTSADGSVPTTAAVNAESAQSAGDAVAPAEAVQTEATGTDGDGTVSEPGPTEDAQSAPVPISTAGGQLAPPATPAPTEEQVPPAEVAAVDRPESSTTPSAVPVPDATIRSGHNPAVRLRGAGAQSLPGATTRSVSRVEGQGHSSVPASRPVHLSRRAVLAHASAAGREGPPHDLVVRPAHTPVGREVSGSGEAGVEHVTRREPFAFALAASLALLVLLGGGLSFVRRSRRPLPTPPPLPEKRVPEVEVEADRGEADSAPVPLRWNRVHLVRYTTGTSPGRRRLAVCGRPASPRACRVVRAGGRLRALPPLARKRRSDGVRHGRARHTRDGRRRQGGRVTA
jgi:hypothetical protein